MSLSHFLNPPLDGIISRYCPKLAGIHTVPDRLIRILLEERQWRVRANDKSSPSSSKGITENDIVYVQNRV